MRKKAICIICKNQELFLSLKRALKIYFPDTHYCFYNTEIIEKDNLENMYCPDFKKQGAIIAFFWNTSDDELTCRIIRYLRIKKGLRFPIICCSPFDRGGIGNNHVLKFGNFAHPCCYIPFDIDDLATCISNAPCISDGYYEQFVYFYSGEFKKIYSDKIKPLIVKMSEEINKEENLQNEIEQLKDILRMKMVRGRISHLSLSYNGENMSVAGHLDNELAKLSEAPLPKKTFNDICNIFDLLIDKYIF
jgi:hypothetical protein